MSQDDVESNPGPLILSTTHRPLCPSCMTGGGSVVTVALRWGPNTLLTGCGAGQPGRSPGGIAERPSARPGISASLGGASSRFSTRTP